MTRIAFLGTGIMGRGMALNLIKAGHEVSVWNRTAVKTAPLIEAGASPADTPADAVLGAEVIITIVADDAASEVVWLGVDGILAGTPAPNAIGIESSTLSRDWMITLGQKVEAAGLRFLDCPVTGGPDGSLDGNLIMLVGGAGETLEATKPVLDAYTKLYYHFGDVGAGTAYKLIVNTVGAVHNAAVAEAMAVARKAGLDLDQVADALSTGSVASSAVKVVAPCMARDTHDTVRFATRWRYKDACYGTNMAHALGCTTPLFDAATDLYSQAVDAGWGDLNQSAVSRLVR